MPRSLYESALVVLVPEAEAVVGRLRQRYDPSAAVGMPAHITLNYPFLPGEPVKPATIEQLRVLFSRFSPLRYSLIEARQFFDTVYLAPHPDGPFMELIQAVIAGLAILVNRFIQIASGLRLTIVLTVSFGAGFLGYFSYQFLMLLASAF